MKNFLKKKNLIVNLIEECTSYSVDGLKNRVVNSAETWKYIHKVVYILPQSLNGLINAVKYAEQNDLKVKAIGSRHSFSMVCQTHDCYIDTTDLNPYKALKNKHKALNHNRDVNKLDQNSLTLLNEDNDISVDNLLDIPSSMRVWMLNHILYPDNKKDIKRFGNKRIFNMGGGDVQHFCGAFSTGTHGSGGMKTAYHDMVRSIMIVGSYGEVYRIEPQKGITNKTKHDSFYKNKEIKVQLIQDDDLFYATLVNMGCFGVIYSCIIEIIDMSFLYEEKTHFIGKKYSNEKRFKWNAEFKKKFEKSILKEDEVFYSVQVNPYKVRKNKFHSIMINKAVPMSKSPLKKKKSIKNRPFWPSALSMIDPKIIQGIANSNNNTAAGVIETALKQQNDNSTSIGKGYYDLPYKVWNAGSGKIESKGVAIEFAFPTNKVVPVLDKLFEYLNFWKSTNSKYFLNVPISLRFSRTSKAFLANNYHTFKGEKIDEWCHVEILRVHPEIRKKEDKELELYEHLQIFLLNEGGRPHWGLNFNFPFSENNIDKLYPEFNKWLKAFLFFNESAVFDNEFTDSANLRNAAKRKANKMIV